MKLHTLLTSFAIALAVLITGCMKDDFVEVPGVCPIVLTTNPANLATHVPTNKIITATFNVKMNPLTITPDVFSLQNAKQGTVNDNPGKMSYDKSTNTLTFVPSSPLLENTTYIGTIKSTVKDLKGTGLAGNYVWTFSTGELLVPTVISTNPLNLAANVVLNKTLTADFSVAMDAPSLTGSTFTLYNGATQVAGVVSCSGVRASFNPNVDLLRGVLYTATITSGAQSEGGTGLASDYKWTFTTIATGVPFISAVDPLDHETNVALDKVISAEFSEVMDATSITNVSFTLKNGPVSISGSVNYAGTTATFTPDVDLVLGKTYTATVTTVVQNLAGTGIPSDYVWTFSTDSIIKQGPGIVNLGTAGNFAVLSKAGISTTGTTSIIGDVGVSPASSTALTGFGLIMDPSNEFSVTPIVTGKVYASNYSPPTPAYVTTAINDMETALTSAMGMTLSVINELGGGNISGMTLAPGLYKWGTGLLITGAGVTLSGGPNDTWVFQVSDDFTVNGDIILSGGAQAKNIFWVTNTQAILNTGIDFKGNILAQTLISLNTGAKVTGCLLSQTEVTLNAATVVKP